MMKKLFPAVALALASVVATSYAADLLETATARAGVKSFAASIRSSGLSETMKNNGPFTIFAPSNSALDKLPQVTRDAYRKDKDKVAKLVGHHVIPGRVLVADVKPGKVQTIAGTVVTLRSDNGKITVDDANVTESGVPADNGVIHVIDTVLLPAE